MTIVTKEWDNKTGELESENKYVLVKKKGKDGLMHIVKEEFKIVKGKEIDISDNWKHRK